MSGQLRHGARHMVQGPCKAAITSTNEARHLGNGSFGEATTSCLGKRGNLWGLRLTDAIGLDLLFSLMRGTYNCFLVEQESGWCDLASRR